MKHFIMRNIKTAALLVSLLGMLAAMGCSKKEAAPPPAPEKTSGGVSIESQAEAAPPPPTQPAATGAGGEASPPDAVPPDRGATGAKEQELLDGVFSAYRNFYADKLRYARDMDELVKSGYLKKAPVPPPGKKIVLDPKNFNVYLAPL